MFLLLNEPTTVKIEKPKTDPDEETQYETLQDIVEIKAGTEYSMAIMKNGDTYTWGHNGYGQLGVGNTERKIKPTKTNIYDSKDTTQTEYAIDVAAGAYHTLVLKSDGTVWTTGYNGYGQLGTGNSNKINNNK
jgi:alpha-tubulin suppressor-like RCC1 family protein